MKDIQQLIKKNSQEGRYEDIFPKTFIDAVEDRESGNNLTEILSGFNMYFLSYNGSREQTRLQVPMSIRKTGLWITYVLYDKTVVTEWYAGEAIDDNSWKNLSNWRVGSNMLVGDISISSDGYWVVNGVVTTTKAQGEQGITPMLRVGSNNHLQVSYTNGSSWVDASTSPVYTQFRINNNKLEQSVDLGQTWAVVSDYIASWFRFTGTSGSSQVDNVGKIQISRDNGVTWSDLSGEFTNSLHIKGYVATVATLPSTAVQGDIYGVGPTYDPSDTEQTNPIYQLYVKDSTGWVDNGRFTSIAAGVVQDFGNSETAVMSQNAVGKWIGKSKLIEAYPLIREKFVATSNVGTISNQVVTIPAGTTISQGSYYGLSSGVASQVGKTLYVELHSNIPLEAVSWTNGAGLPLNILSEYNYSDDTGIVYGTVFNITSGDSGIILQLIYSVDTTKNYVLSFPTVGIYNENYISKVIQDVENASTETANKLVTLQDSFSENLIINSIMNKVTPVSNRVNYLIGGDFIIPANPSDIGTGAYYGLSSSSLTGKTVTAVLKATNKLKVLPTYYADGGAALSSTYNIELRVSDGWSYITTFTIPSDKGMVFIIPYNIIQDFTIPNVLSFKDIGETYSGDIKDKVESNKEAISNLNKVVEDNLIVEVTLEDYRSSLVATSNQTAALNKEILTIPVGADWGTGSYYGFISNLSNLFGKEVTIQLLSSTKLTNLPVWVNGGTSIPNISVKEEQAGSSWLYTNILNLVGISSGNIILQPAIVLDYTMETIWSIPFIGIKETIPSKDAIEGLYDSIGKGGIHYTIVTANSDENSNADFKGNLAIQQAFESITDASETNQYIVRATGNFLITSPNDYLNIPSLGAWVYIQHKDYVHLDGIDKDSCIIRCELSENLSEVQAEKSSFVKSDYGNYQPTFWNSKANISNVTFVVRNIRYPLHIDGGTDGCKDYVQLIDNCNLIHEGKYGDSIGTVGGSASGFGMSSGQQLTLRNCYLEGTDGWVYVHDNRNFTDGSLLYFDSCKFLDSVGYSREITIQGLNSLVASTIRLRNCTLPKHGRIEYTSSVYESTKLRADTLNYVCDMKDMCPMSVRTPASITKALRIVSKSTGSTSTVRVDPDSTAFSIIGFKDEVSLVPRNRYNRKEQYGYQYRDGGDGLQGEAIGFANVMENAIRGKYLTSLGKRLGDCSTVNKTLTIVIDGTSYNVVFNKNYNGTAENALPNYTNAQIISEVNTVIGSVATIEEYDINKEWYPLFKDVQMFKVNSATYIEKGMGVVFTDNMNVRKATTSDTIIDGIALDNGVKGSFIRVMQSGCVAGSNSFHYSLSRGETFTDSDNLLVGIVSDGKFGPSATNKTLRYLSNAYGKLK